MNRIITFARDLLAFLRFLTKVSWWLLRALIASLGVWRMPANVADLRFPVLLISSDFKHAYAVATRDDLKRPPSHACDVPEDGMIAIDANFQIYGIHDVSSREGDFKQIARILFARNMRYTYSFRLERRSR